MHTKSPKGTNKPTSQRQLRSSTSEASKKPQQTLSFSSDEGVSKPNDSSDSDYEIVKTSKRTSKRGKKRSEDEEETETKRLRRTRASKTNKGKSKSNKSKSARQEAAADAKSDCDEISENVQVTSQSPPRANNDTIPVDNVNEGESNRASSPVVSENDDNVKESDSEHFVSVKENAVVEQEIVLEVEPTQGDTEMLDFQADKSNSNEASEPMEQEVETRSKSTSPEQDSSPQIDHQENLSNKDPADDPVSAPLQSDDDSRSVDAIVLNESSNTPPRENFTLTETLSAEIPKFDTVNEEIQEACDEIGKVFETPEKKERKYKWGDSLVGLEHIKPSVRNITLDTILEFCPNVVFLDERETRLMSEKKRPVSVDYKSDDENNSSFEDAAATSNSETDNSNIIALNRKISIVDDTASKLRPPPSPARNPVSSVLYISNLVRPFTLKQLMELLKRTGRIKEDGFWTDRIKSKCFVEYETAEDAEATRNALHGVNWPIGNGKQLMLEYSTQEEFERARNPAPAPAPPPPAPPMEKPPKVDKENEVEKQIPPKRLRQESQQHDRTPKEKERHRSEGRTHNWGGNKEEIHNNRRHSRGRHDSRERNDRRRHLKRSLTPTDYMSKKQREEEPQKLMDDLFHKTKAAPSVYWLPLTPEEIATKQQERLLRMAEHKRRMDESSRNRGEQQQHGRGAPYRRRYD